MMNTREALAMARELGCQVEWIDKTGEIRITHPKMAKWMRINGRRKDTPRKLLSFLTGVQRASSAGRMA